MTVFENLKKLNERIDKAVETIQDLKNCMNCDHCEIEENWKVCCREEEHPNMRAYICDNWKMRVAENE